MKQQTVNATWVIMETLALSVASIILATSDAANAARC